MSTDRDTTRIVRSWLEEGATALPDRVLDAVLDQLPATPQRRAWWPARRFSQMNVYARFAVAAAAVTVLAVASLQFLPESGGAGGADATPSPSPTASPAPLPEGEIPPGRYVVTPWAESSGLGLCVVPRPSGCTETPDDDSIRLTFAVPAGWEAVPEIPLLASTDNGPADGAIITFIRGAWLYSEPCQTRTTNPDIPIGPTVDDFADAIADHPKLDATEPVPVTLGGYSGRYLEIQGPADISACTDNYRPWEPGIYARGPGDRWHLWILDIDGVRVVVQFMAYAGTSAEHRAQALSIVDSMQFEP